MNTRLVLLALLLPLAAAACGTQPAEPTAPAARRANETLAPDTTKATHDYSGGQLGSGNEYTTDPAAPTSTFDPMAAR